MRNFAGLLICILLSFGCSDGAEEAADALRPEPRVADIDLVIGEREGAEPYLFGNISGLAVDGEGRIFVADFQAHEIRVFGPDGSHQFTFGGKGKGPGELYRPCCLAWGPDGHLWVRDGQNRRYTAFKVAGKKVEPVEHVSITHGTFGLLSATTFDRHGHLIDVGAEGPPVGPGRFQLVPIHRSMQDSTVRKQEVPVAPQDRVAVFQATTEEGYARFYHEPYGPDDAMAHGPRGEWAFSITDRYEVVRFNATGDTVHAIERSVRGPSLSPAEEAWAESQMEEIVEETDASPGEIPFDIPDRKPPLQHIFFDEGGRLWVQRTVPDSVDLAEADVYDRDGTLVDVVRWPVGVDLEYGYIREGVAYGTRSTSATVPQVVRLRY